MKFVVDDKIPYIRETLAMLADEVVYLKGSAIGPDDVRDADALIVRTRTQCDERLLKGSKVQFVGTATIGYDHIDTTWCEQNGIVWTNCPGCNAGSVAQYVESALLTLMGNGQWKMDNAPLTLAVVGCGHVGSKVCKIGERLGMRVLVNDPPLEKTMENGEWKMDNSPLTFVSLDDIAREADIITFHVPLDDTTRYLANASFFERLKKKPVVINSSRGGVVDEAALMQALDDRKVSRAVIDTWENEPDISRALLNKVYIGTPHIAGYSADGKVNADNMIIEALCRHFNLPQPPQILPPPPTFNATYDIMEDCRKLKTHPEMFEEIRGNYPVRRENFKW